MREIRGDTETEPMTTSDSTTIKNHASFIWSVADLLRGDYKQSEYGKVILPLTVLRRLDCVLEPTKTKVLGTHIKYAARSENLDPVLTAASGQQFFNTSKLTMPRLLDDPSHVADNLMSYVAGFSAGARDVLDKFDFPTQVRRLDRSNLLYKVLARFCDIDLHPDAVSNIEMGYIYEELVRRFSELSNETAGEHFTPREVIQLMVRLLFIEDDGLLTKKGIVKTLYDPACGTGGMLSVAEDHLRQLNPAARLEVFGQELNAETYAICRSDMMLKGQDATHIVFGNSFTDDGHPNGRFDYLLANPPFGVEWKKVEDEIKSEHDKLGFGGRFGAGLPRINDGSFLFLQHMISKMKPPHEGGSRLAIVFNGSPLFSGAAGSGESEIRRWIIENDWLDAVIALPDSLFYNTGINTYFWVVTNRKSLERRGTVQLVDARASWTKMRKSLGAKRKQIANDQIAEIVRLYGDHADGDRVKILPNESFGSMRITVERPLRLRWEVSDETLAAVTSGKHVSNLPQTDLGYLSRRLQALDRPITPSGVRAVMNDLALNTKSIQAEVLGALAVRDPDAEIVTDRRGNAEPDPDLRDQENVPLPEMKVGFVISPTGRMATVVYRSAVEDYIRVEVLPYFPDAWVDHDKTKIGYEIPFTRQFYKYVPSRPLVEIDAEIKRLEAEIQELLREVTQ
jgi:type I restriction enzyme M protein